MGAPQRGRPLLPLLRRWGSGGGHAASRCSLTPALAAAALLLLAAGALLGDSWGGRASGRQGPRLWTAGARASGSEGQQQAGAEGDLGQLAAAGIGAAVAAADAARPLQGPAAGAPGSATQPLLFYSVGTFYRVLPNCSLDNLTPHADRLCVECERPPGSCPVSYEWTTNRTLADAVIYNTLDGMKGYGGAGMRARPGQKLVLAAMESGLMNFSVHHAKIYRAKEDHGVDISADYRLDVAEVPIVYYARIEFGDLKDPYPSFAEKRKDALVAAFIGNCQFTSNGRTQLLKDLIQLLPGQVHSYGGCMHNKDPDPGTPSGAGSQAARYQQKIAIFSKYKFAFVPENSNDAGYVTEKIYHALKAGSIPIYMGAPDLHRFVPTMDAVILASNFSSAAALAEHLKRVASDEALWNKYMAWKSLPEAQFSQGWHELQRLQARSWVCRLAMYVAGTPYQLRDGELDSSSSGGDGSSSGSSGSSSSSSSGDSSGGSGAISSNASGGSGTGGKQ